MDRAQKLITKHFSSGRGTWVVQELTDAGWEVQDQKMALGILELLIS